MSYLYIFRAYYKTSLELYYQWLTVSRDSLLYQDEIPIIEDEITIKTDILSMITLGVMLVKAAK